MVAGFAALPGQELTRLEDINNRQLEEIEAEAASTSEAAMSSYADSIDVQV